VVDQIRSLQSAVKAARLAVAETDAPRVARESTKKAVRLLVNGYFREQRPVLASKDVPEESLAAVDADVQGLLRLTQGRASKQAYLARLAHLRAQLNRIEVDAISTTGQPAFSRLHADVRDERILATLDQMCPPAAASYRQGLTDLGDSSRLSWRGTATEFRESLREVLDHLAPDDKVRAQPGFRLEPKRDGPTMAQKTRFILASRGLSRTASRPAEDAVDVVEERVGSFVRSVYSRSARSTHGEPTHDEVQRIRSYVQVALGELLAVGS